MNLVHVILEGLPFLLAQGGEKFKETTNVMNKLRADNQR